MVGSAALSTAGKGVVIAIRRAQPRAVTRDWIGESKAGPLGVQLDLAALVGHGRQYHSTIAGESNAPRHRVVVKPQLAIPVSQSLVFEYLAMGVAVSFKGVQPELCIKLFASAGKQNVDGVGVVLIRAIIRHDGALKGSNPAGCLGRGVFSRGRIGVGVDGGEVSGWAGVGRGIWPIRLNIHAPIGLTSGHARPYRKKPNGHCSPP